MSYYEAAKEIRFRFSSNATLSPALDALILLIEDAIERTRHTVEGGAFCKTLRYIVEHLDTLEEEE